MKKLNIHTTKYKNLIEEFGKWLQHINSSETTIYTYTNQIREFLHYLEQNNITEINKVQHDHIQQFDERIQTRENEMYGGALSAVQINCIRKTVNVFFKFLRQTKGSSIHSDLITMKSEKKKIDVLSVEEVGLLLASIDVSEPLGLRTRAIIGLFYGAALRKSELEFCKIDNIYFEDELVKVEGKGRKERMVPLPERTLEYLKAYIAGCRDLFEDAAEYTDDYLFIQATGKRMTEKAIYKVVHETIDNCGVESIQKKKITPHIFRHSCATHLLQAGMDIEDIARFLGHYSLDSTMIYTHILNGTI
jgi:site-specific recombinase XerD